MRLLPTDEARALLMLWSCLELLPTARSTHLRSDYRHDTTRHDSPQLLCCASLPSDSVHRMSGLSGCARCVMW